MHRPWFLPLMLAASIPAALAASPDDFCLEPLPRAPALRPETPPVRHTGRETWTVPGLDLQIDSPVEGIVRFTDLKADRADEAWFPSGDSGLSFNYFDAESGRVYGVNAQAGTGWVQVRRSAGGPEIVGTGMVRPNLTRRPDDRHGLFLANAHYSPLLRRGFYDGYAMSWCCDWLRDHRSLEFDLGEGVGRPIPGAGDRPLVYQGDDPVAQKAVLRNTATGELFWYDGAQVLNPWPDRVGPLLPWRKDPQTGDPLLRDAKGKPYRFNGATAAPLDVTGVLDGPARWLGYRPAFDRWILATEREWYRYKPGEPLVPLGMPARVASAWPPDLIDTPAGMDRWIFTASSLWWENPEGASLVAILSPPRWIGGPAHVRATATGDALALAVETDVKTPAQWVALRPRSDGETCRSPRALPDLVR